MLNSFSSLEDLRQITAETPTVREVPGATQLTLRLGGSTAE